MRRLVTIPISHFCEKARWALERAGLPYREERHVQGLHILASRRAGGRDTTPVLVAPEGVFAESEDIVAYADRALPPAERLLPDDPARRAEALELSRGFDSGLGPDGRRLMYAHMLGRKRQMMDVNCQGVPRWERAALEALWPAAVGRINRHLGVEPDGAERDEAAVWRTFEEVGRRLADGRRHLCGDGFTIADLTFAALAAPVLVPPEYGVRLPQPDELPAPLSDKLRAFRDHPAGRFGLRVFGEQRRRRAGPAG